MRMMFFGIAAILSIVGLTLAVYQFVVPGASLEAQTPKPESATYIFRLPGLVPEVKAGGLILISMRDQCVFFVAGSYQKALALRWPWTKPAVKRNACTPEYSSGSPRR